MGTCLHALMIEVSDPARGGAGVATIKYSSTPSEALTLGLPILGAGVSVFVDEDPDEGDNRYRVSVLGTHAAGKKWCSDVFVTRGFLRWNREGNQMLVLASNVEAEDLSPVVARILALVRALRDQEEAASFSGSEVVSMYWSSGLLNMGDWAGPHIVNRLTGRLPIQADRVGAGSRCLYSVGSILS